MAIVDAQYRFVAVDIGAFGKQSDGGTFSAWNLGRAITSGSFDKPDRKPLPNTNILLPHAFVADAAFPLSENLLRPYPGKNLAEEKKIFNYRLSHARRIVENAFGILAARWRIFTRTIGEKPIVV